MSFFNSKKYIEFSSQKQRDSLGGLLPNSFPWFIRESLFRDNDGDSWKISIDCKRISPSNEKEKVFITFGIQVKSQLSEKTLIKTNIQNKRLQYLVSSEWQTIKLESEKKVLDKLEGIEKTAQEIEKHHEILLKKNMDIEKKKELLNEKLKKIYYSSF